jgi:hypothetical protein
MAGAFEGEDPMSSLERRLLFFAMTLLFLAFIIWTAGEGRFPTAIAQAASAHPNDSTSTYYGADISANGGMAVATGVQPTNTRPTNGPWPQYTRNYCFIAVVQAVANYGYWKQGKAISFPHQNNQGPLNDNPNFETRTNPHQILYDMDHYMKPTFGTIRTTGSGSSRRPFTLANSSRDFGGDPRAQAYAAWYETPNLYYYHQYIYHNGVGGATYGLAKGVAFSFSDGPAPEIAIVNHGEHSVIIAGAWASANPSTNSAATIDSFAVYNPWDQLNFGSYLNGAYYARVSYADWITSSWWWGPTYSSNNGADPDPIIGIYQAGAGTSHPTAKHWIGNYVSIQRDNDATDNANYSIDENGKTMQNP